ncbi:MAG: DUF2309 domain-containing protein [Bdellovibrio sp.]|nr:DUF2309 domain-containing protein [Methylotenera sp.]
MSNLKQNTQANMLTTQMKDAIDKACAAIAPTWPLDQFIAVNPWWEMTDQPIEAVSAKLKTLANINCLMPSDYYLSGWQNNTILKTHIAKAAKEQQLDVTIEALVNRLEFKSLALKSTDNQIKLLSDLLDDTRDLNHEMSWHDEISQQISQFCAAYFNQGSMLQFPSQTGLYQSWLLMVRQDVGIEILMGVKHLSSVFKTLPNTPEQLIALAINELGVAEHAITDYCHALLLNTNGWASWVAYLRWQDRLNGKENVLMNELVAIRMAWALVIWRHCESAELKQAWHNNLQAWPAMLAANLAAQKLDWCWQRAAEIAYQENLQKSLLNTETNKIQQPILQAAFCIDVRSEVFRRALEKQDKNIQTIGFAGFFGLPIEYQPAGSEMVRPQLPGLLKPTIRAQEINLSTNTSANKRQNRFANIASWHRFSRSAPATFTYVEATGIFYAYKLLKASLFPSNNQHPINALNAKSQATFALTNEAGDLSLDDRKNLAAGILGAMSLTQHFAPIVLLIGHGSETCNNAHAAGLDCGACGGQTGEVNVRIVADLLNTADIRAVLALDGIIIPAQTRFLAGLHNTTSDNITLYDLKKWPVDSERIKQVNTWLEAASSLARIERSTKLGISTTNEQTTESAILERTKDWSQVRPEWGLANNASFIVAPRHRTAHLNCEGRSFLHDYSWQNDKDFKVLELIMTAPMIVTHWINLQYYASVTDNLKYGSGNKVLHNVVGGNIGVFEGNGGDLRIGLSMQSLHDGKQWMHQPLRLSVYIEAPQSAIQDVVNKYQFVKNLIDNNWLYLFSLDNTEQVGAIKQISRYYQGDWNKV